MRLDGLPENDLLVFRRGMYATYGKKIRYYAEKKLAARTKIPSPVMPTIRVDPAVAHNSLRVIAAAEADGSPSATSAATVATTMIQYISSEGPDTRRLNRAAIDAAKSVPPGEHTTKFFQHLVNIEGEAA